LVQEIPDNGPYYDDAEADFGGDGSMNFDDMLGNGDMVDSGDYFFDAVHEEQEMYGDVLSAL